MRSLPSNCGTLHFVGIGGIGMSGIAEVMNTLGYKIQGSDIADSSNVQRLRKSGIRILIGHEAGNVKTDDGSPVAAVVISSAIKPDNPELQAARTAKIPVVRRAEMLAELMRLKWAVAIGGTHGKTTTTSMVGTMMEHAGFDPTVINGGIVNAYGTNTRLGKSDWMVVEADESDGTFTRLPAAVSIVTNIDPEHLDHYGTFDNIREAFRTFVENVPFYGFAVMCSDHPEVQTLVAKVTDKRVITYGFNPQADVRGSNVKSGPEGSAYDVTFAGWLKGGEDVTFRDVHLPMPGIHNVQNSLAALAVAYEMDVPQAVMKKGIGSFAGVKRRFTKTGETGGILVIDDYGHHPVEITAVLKAARVVAEARKGRVIAVMQPHRYTRLSSLFDSFCTCFNDADTVIVANVYAAGEQPVEGASRDALAQGIRAHGHRDVQVLDGADKLPALIAGMARENDMVVCLGAGDITQWAYALPGKLEEILASQKKQRA